MNAGLVILSGVEGSQRRRYEEPLGVDLALLLRSFDSGALTLASAQDDRCDSGALTLASAQIDGCKAGR